MRALAALLMRGRFHAITAAAVCGALSLMVPPLTYVSGAVIGLSTLKQGVREGVIVIAGAAVLSALFSMLMVGSPAPAVAFVLVSWVPAWLMAMALITWRSLAAALLCATGLGVAAVVLLHLVHEDPAQWWQQMMTQFFAPILEGQPGGATDVATNLGMVIEVWAPRMTRYFGAATVSGLMLTLVLARWWHASLDNPGGFGREFRSMKVGRGMLALSAALGVGMFLVPAMGQGIVGDLMGPLAAMLVFQGLSVVHGLVQRRKASTAWLVALYAFLVIPPHLVVPVLCLVGVVDGWLDFRARVPEKS